MPITGVEQAWFEEPPRNAGGVEQGRYNLRRNRTSWRNKQAFRLTVRRAIDALGEGSTLQAICSEVQQMVAKQVWKK